jgi:hypothetical protein
MAIKVEGTTQTYGQLIYTPSQSTPATVAKSTQQATNVAPNDTAVAITSTNLTAAEKSKIAVAAANSAGVAKASALGGAVAIVAGSTIKTKIEVKKALDEAKKIDLNVTLKSKQSETVQFNTLKTPDMQAKFVYQFYAPDEEDIATQEDPAQDPLLKTDIHHVPRYVELSWEPPQLSEPLTDEEKSLTKEEKEEKKAFYNLPKGVATHFSEKVKNSYENSKKKVNLLQQEGIKAEVVDLHKLDVAFDSTVNKQLFTNSIAATLNTIDKPGVIDVLPIKIK